MSNPFIGQRVYLSDATFAAEVKPDGSVYAADFTFLGRFQGNRFYDANFEYIGEVRADGTIIDASFQYRGRIVNEGGPGEGHVENPDFTRGASLGYPFGA